MSTRASALKLSSGTPADREHKSILKVGLFVTSALLLGSLVVVLLGQEHRLFVDKVRYHAYFEDIDGLAVGSPVRLGGMTVGEVVDISFQEDLKDTRIRVDFELDEKSAIRVRTNSVARIGSRGVLGDKTVDISVGSAEAAQVAEGSTLTSGVGGDIASMLKASGEVVDNVVAVSRDVRRAVEAYTDPKLTQELTGTVSSLRNILGAVEHGDGALHKVIYDPKTADDVGGLIAQATQAAGRFDSALTRVDAILNEVQSGQGSAHALIYGDEGKVLMRELGEAAHEVATLLEDAKKSENGAVRQLVYGDSRGMLSDLGAAATHLKRITERVDRGDGTLGALINDPTVYEDVKTVLGNVKRNRVLRGLVRFSLSNRDEFESSGKPVEPQAAQPSSAGGGSR